MLESDKQDGLSFFRRLPWAKMVTWSVFLGLVYILSSLFAVIFITFVVSYICRNIVRFAYSPFGDRPFIRKIIVILTFILLLLGFYLGGRFLVPNIYDQGYQVFKMVRNLGIHEDLDNAVPNLYAKLRFWVYEGSESHKEDLEAYRNEQDVGKLGYDRFQESSETMRRAFRDQMIQERGKEAFREARNTQAYEQEFIDRQLEWIEKEFEARREELVSTKEEELRSSMSGASFDRLKKQFGATDEDWVGYLKNEIIRDFYARFDTDRLMKIAYQQWFNAEYIQREGQRAIADLEGEEAWEEAFQAYYEGLPEEEREYTFEKFVELERAKTQQEYSQILGDLEKPEENLALAFKKDKEEEFARNIKGTGFMDELNTKVKKDFLPFVTKWVANAIEYTVTLAFHLIISVFLSFFIVWDIPRLKGMVQRLGDSRVGEIYQEVCPGLVSFGWLMGRAFQAQAVIAAVNTALTLSALNLLDVPHRTFLCSIVFICSFIPVVGVVISSIPIVVVGLQLPGGIILALELVGCILIVHFIETTVLNPKIMGDMLKLHPLLVLVILLVGEHFFGVWGLLLGVPVSVYIFRFVILQDTGGLAARAVDAMMGRGAPKAGKAK